MATVRIPTPLRAFTGGKEEVSVDGATVDEVIANLGAAHPDLKARICDADGGIRRFINLYVNDEDIRGQDGTATAVGVSSQ